MSEGTIDRWVRPLPRFTIAVFALAAILPVAVFFWSTLIVGRRFRNITSSLTFSLPFPARAVTGCWHWSTRRDLYWRLTLTLLPLRYQWASPHARGFRSP